MSVDPIPSIALGLTAAFLAAVAFTDQGKGLGSAIARGLMQLLAAGLFALALGLPVMAAAEGPPSWLRLLLVAIVAAQVYCKARPWMQRLLADPAE